MHIPLHTHPYDLSDVARLAQAVMCGAQQGCRVRFSASLPQPVELDMFADPLFATSE